MKTHSSTIIRTAAAAILALMAACGGGGGQPTEPTFGSAMRTAQLNEVREYSRAFATARTTSARQQAATDFANELTADFLQILTTWPDPLDGPKVIDAVEVYRQAVMDRVLDDYDSEDGSEPARTDIVNAIDAAFDQLQADLSAAGVT